MYKPIFIYLAITFLLHAEIVCQVENQSLNFHSEQFNIAVNPQNGDYVVLAKDSFYLFNSSRPEGWKSFRYKTNELDTVLNQPVELNFIHTSKQVIFFAGGGGQIYTFRDSSILRMDHSFLQKNQFGACGFEYKDKILLYGGYGFYSYKPYITEFSEKTKEWFLRPYASHQYLPKGRQAVVYQADENLGHFYMSSGYTLENPYMENVNNQELNDVWRFDLNENTWQQLGHIKDKNRIRNLRFPFLANGIFYAFEKGPNNAVVKIDIKNNSFKKYKTDHLVDQILVEYGTVYNPKDDQIITVIKNKVVNNGTTYSVILIPLVELEKNLLTAEKYYFTLFDQLKPFFLMILGFVVIVFLNTQLKKRKKLILDNKPIIIFNQDENKVIFENTPILFDEEHLTFLYFLFEKGGEISNNELLDFIRKGQESTDTLKKRKLKLIMDINQIFKISTGLGEIFLLELKDDNDRRYKDYVINPIFEIRA